MILRNFFVTILLVMITYLHAQNPLLTLYPQLKKSISYVSLGQYPTPVIRVENFEKSLGIKSFYIKDDGYSVYDEKVKSNIPSGNKTRKLEYLLADAKAKGYETVCTVGSAGSNHALQTAICARALGMKAVLVLDDQRQTGVVIRNLKLMVFFGAEVLYASEKYDTNEKIEAYAQDICSANNYYFIPIGGSNELGVIGYVNAMFEIKQQFVDMNLPDPDYIYVTLGSTGTAAGVIIGARAAGLKSKIIPVRISYTPEYKSQFLCNLINKTGRFLKSKDQSFCFDEAMCDGTQIKMPGLDVEINHEFVGDGYAAITPQAATAIDLLYKACGIKLEHTYTGKTLAAVISDAQKGALKDKSVLFINTFSYGAFKELTDQVTDIDAYAALPEEFHRYLTDSLQPLDTAVDL